MTSRAKLISFILLLVVIGLIVFDRLDIISEKKIIFSEQENIQEKSEILDLKLDTIAESFKHRTEIEKKKDSLIIVLNSTSSNDKDKIYDLKKTIAELENNVNSYYPVEYVDSQILEMESNIRNLQREITQLRNFKDSMSVHRCKDSVIIYYDTVKITVIDTLKINEEKRARRVIIKNKKGED